MQSENVSGSFATAVGTSVYIPSIKYEHHFYYLWYICIYIYIKDVSHRMKNPCKYFIGSHFCIIHLINLWPVNNETIQSSDR